MPRHPAFSLWTLAIVLAGSTRATVAFQVGTDRLEREATAQARQADALFKAGRFAPAFKLYRAERTSRGGLGDLRYEAFALRGMGCCLSALGDDEAAIEAFAEARKLDKDLDDKGFAGYDGLLRGKSLLKLDRAGDAAEALEACLPDLDQAIDRDHEVEARVCLAMARLALGEPDRAATEARRATTIAESLGDGPKLADAWFAEGLAARDLDRPGVSLERIEDARNSFREAGRKADDARATSVLADLSARLGQPRRAAKRFAEAADAHAELGDVRAEADDRLELAGLRLLLADPTSAATEADRARTSFEAEGDDQGVISALVVLAQARPVDASKSIDEALERSTRAHRAEPAERVRLLLLSAEIESSRKRSEVVAERLREAGDIAKTTADPGLISAVDGTRARLVGKP